MEKNDLMRIAIVLDKTLERGKAANVAAILMGQAALSNPTIYDVAPVVDINANKHASIRYSTVILKAGGEQLVNLLVKVNDQPNVSAFAFTQLGQGLHNRYEEYKEAIQSQPISDLHPVGVILVGSDEQIREITKKFSVLD